MLSRKSYFAAATLAVLSAAACSAGDEAAPVASELAPIEDAEQQPAGVEKVFEDRYSEGGTIQVYEDADGLTLLVTGGIGVDDPETIAAAGSLANLFRTLHPEVDRVPVEVEELSARLEAQRASARLEAVDVEAADIEAVDAAAPAATLDKNQSFFNNNVCRSYLDFNLDKQFTKLECKYGPVSSPGTINVNYPGADHVSFTYNDNSTGLTRTRLWFNNNPTTHASLFMSAGLFGFGSWPQFGSGFSVRAGFHDVPNGNIGITLHRVLPIIR